MACPDEIKATVTTVRFALDVIARGEVLPYTDEEGGLPLHDQLVRYVRRHLESKGLLESVRERWISRPQKEFRFSKEGSLECVVIDDAC